MHGGAPAAGLVRPKLAVAGLNPHGGEHGLFGDEEVREIEPAVRRRRRKRVYDVSGPIRRTRSSGTPPGRCDAVSASTTTRGTSAAKIYDFERTVSITAGLPFLRSPPAPPARPSPLSPGYGVISRGLPDAPALLIGIVVLVFLILKTKIHAFPALIIAATLIGLVGGMDPVDVG